METSLMGTRAGLPSMAIGQGTPAVFCGVLVMFQGTSGNHADVFGRK